MIWFPPTEQDFRILQRALNHSPTSNELQDAFRDTRAIVRPETPRWVSESSRRFIQAATGADGKPMVYQRINRQGQRWNPAQLIESLDVKIIRGLVDHLLFDGDRVRGVQLSDGRQVVVTDRVLLAAGAIGSPTILMRSGIGPCDLLTKLGIDVRHASSGVGFNLQDHLVMPVVYRVPDRGRYSAVPDVRSLSRWELGGCGPLTSNLAECGGLFLEQSVQVHATPTHWLQYPARDSASMTIAVNLTQPKSRGRLVVTSTDPMTPPEISPEYLQAEGDQESTIQAVSLVRDLVARPPLDAWCQAELLPGLRRQSDEAVARSISRYAQTLYHCVGTCEMGPGDKDPVDQRGFVRGAERLQIVDASILPRSPVGNPSSLVMTLATLLCR